MINRAGANDGSHHPADSKYLVTTQTTRQIALPAMYAAAQRSSDRSGTTARSINPQFDSSSGQCLNERMNRHVYAELAAK
jgi:hypothetical protein